jgi:hypothetical protein
MQRVEAAFAQGEELFFVRCIDDPVIDAVREVLRARTRQLQKAGAGINRHDASAKVCQAAGRDPIAAADVEDLLAGAHRQETLDRGTDQLSLKRVAFSHALVPERSLGVPDIAHLIDETCFIVHIQTKLVAGASPTSRASRVRANTPPAIHIAEPKLTTGTTPMASIAAAPSISPTNVASP